MGVLHGIIFCRDVERGDTVERRARMCRRYALRAQIVGGLPEAGVACLEHMRCRAAHSLGQRVLQEITGCCTSQRVRQRPQLKFSPESRLCQDCPPNLCRSARSHRPRRLPRQTRAAACRKRTWKVEREVSL